MMYKGVLRKVGGSVVVALPPAILDELKIGAKSTVGIDIEGGGIVLRPQTRPRYSLADLIEACDENAAPFPDDEWVSGPPLGRELL
jgi:antitoxin ChpS